MDIGDRESHRGTDQVTHEHVRWEMTSSTHAEIAHERGGGSGTEPCGQFRIR